MEWFAQMPEQWDGEIAVILAHGAGQGSGSPFMTFFREEIARRGMLSIGFDFEYMVKGRKAPDPQPKMQALYRRVLEETTAAHHPRKMIIGGKSMGGRVASHIAGGVSSVDGLLFLGYPLHPPGKPQQIRDAHLYEIRTPMLFLSGARDPFAKRNLLEAVVRKLPRAALVWTEGGDHSLGVPGAKTAPLSAAADAIEHWVHTTFLDGRHEP